MFFSLHTLIFFLKNYFLYKEKYVGCRAFSDYDEHDFVFPQSWTKGVAVLQRERCRRPHVGLLKHPPIQLLSCLPVENREPKFSMVGWTVCQPIFSCSTGCFNDVVLPNSAAGSSWSHYHHFHFPTNTNAIWKPFVLFFKLLTTITLLRTNILTLCCWNPSLAFFSF